MMKRAKAESLDSCESLDDVEAPEEWNHATVEELSETIQYGYTESAIQNSDFPRFLRITDIQDGNVDWDSVPSCEITNEDFPRYELKEGDIVFARTGATTGKSFLIQSCPKAVFASYLIRIRPNKKVDPKFLYLFFQTSDYWRMISENVSGTGQPNCNASKLKKLQLPVPTLTEQHRIVTRVEALLSQVNAAHDRLSRVPMIMKKFRQAVLAVACSGMLTEGWREENPDVEPTDISEFPFRTQKENEKFLEDLQILKELDFPPLPDGWISCNGNTVFRFITSGSRGWAKYYSDNGVSFIRIGNLTRDSILLDLKNLQKVNPPDSAEKKRIRVQKNDILISITADIGSIGFVSKDIGEAYVNQHIALCRPIDRVNPEYIALFLQSEKGGKIQFLELQRGATKIGLGLDDIRAVYIPLPPLAEQHEIVRRVNGLFERADQIEQQVVAATKRTEVLTQAVLGKAFRGELVPKRMADALV